MEKSPQDKTETIAFIFLRFLRSFCNGPSLIFTFSDDKVAKVGLGILQSRNCASILFKMVLVRIPSLSKALFCQCKAESFQECFEACKSTSVTWKQSCSCQWRNDAFFSESTVVQAVKRLCQMTGRTAFQGQRLPFEAIAKLPPNRQNAASEGEERKRGVVTTLSLSDEAIAPRREGGWDESFAIASYIFWHEDATCPQSQGLAG